MLRLVRLPIAQISHGELGCSGEIIVDPYHPQRLQIQQMPGMFLCRPFFVFARSNQDLASSAADDFFHSRRCASQPHAQIRVLFDRKREIKRSFKPNRRSAHDLRGRLAF